MKKLSREEIKVRLLLLFCWLPVGIVFLAKSKTIKHKVSIGFLYLALFALFGFPIVYFVMLLLSGITDGMNLTVSLQYSIEIILEYFSEIGWFYLFLLMFALIIRISIIVGDYRRGKVTEIRENTIQINKKNIFGVEEILNKSNISQKEDCSLSLESNSYQKATLLTDRESNFYETIRLIAEKHNLNVSAKVRLADIVNVSDEIQKQSSLWWSKFEKISQKHIDFALADKSNLEIKLLIEIDDSTHQREDRIERDEFVDSVCKQANIPILHLYDVIGLEDKIINILHSEKTE